MDNESNAAAYGRIAAEVEANLNWDILPMWYPGAVDNVDGGFHENYSEDWSTVPDTQKSIVYQSRLTWLAAQAAIRYPARAAEYGQYAGTGSTIFADILGQGVRRSLLGLGTSGSSGYFLRSGQARVRDILRHLCQCGRLPRNSRCRGPHAGAGRVPLAGELVHTIPKTADTTNSSPGRESPSFRTLPAYGNSVGPLGHKTMNTHIHLLEAFTALYEVWPDAQLLARLGEVFQIVRDRVVTPEGYLELYFMPDWTRVDGGDSMGTMSRRPTCSPKGPRPGHTRRRPDLGRGSSPVDHALAYGWDDEHDGFFDHGHPDGEPTVTDKIWWVQAEGLNALLLLHERYGSEDPRYFDAFTRQWAFIENYQVDKIHGGW